MDSVSIVSPDNICRLILMGRRWTQFADMGINIDDENVVGIQKLNIGLCDRGGTECAEYKLTV